MGCEGVPEWMAQALDGDLGPKERESLENHLARCERCRVEWERLQAVERLLQGTVMARPSAGFAGRVMAHLDRRRRLGRAFLGGLALAAGTAVVVSLTLAPALWTLPGLTNELLALSCAGDVLIGRLADAAGTMLNSLRLSAEALALPVVSLLLCGLILALVANLMWLSLIRRLRPAAAVLVRR
jgi:anti-sigma factor RsiW